MPDIFTDLMLEFINTPLFSGFLGSLTLSGQGTAQIHAPALDPGLAGITLCFSYCLNNYFDFVSNPVAVTLAP
ncbi:MAG: hypothetical protein ABIK28_16100 [Planctomycetota bacterium]